MGPETQKKILQMVISSYAALFQKHQVQLDWEEDNITAALCWELDLVWRDLSRSSPIRGLAPLPQFPVYPKPSKYGRAPTIDFVLSREYSQQIYFAFECKIVDHSDGSLVAKYIDKGMKRYIIGYYAQAMRTGGMIGYMFSNEVRLTVEAINLRIRGREDMSPNDCLDQESMLNGYHDLYKSKHCRTFDNSSFLLYHLFFAF